MKLYIDKKLQEKIETSIDKKEYILLQYYIYKKLFIDKLEIKLLEYIEQDYKIKIINSKNPLFSKIYLLN